MDVIVFEWKLLQLSISLQIINLLLQSLQESFSSTHFSLFSISDHLYHLRAASLNGPDQFSTYPLTVLHCRLCKALLRHTNNQTVHADQPVKCIGLQWDQIQDLPEVSSLLKTPLVSLRSLSQPLKHLDSLLELSLRLLQSFLYKNKTTVLRNIDVHNECIKSNQLFILKLYNQKEKTNQFGKICYLWSQQCLILIRSCETSDKKKKEKLSM